jgi:hypothetical protein
VASRVKASSGPVAAGVDRHTLDRIARAVVSGRRGLGARADRLADRAAGMTRNRLAAMGAPGAARAARMSVRRRPLAAEPAVLRKLLERVAKHLAAAGRGGADATAPSR